MSQKILTFCFSLLFLIESNAETPGKLKIFTPDDERFQYTGRIDFSNPLLPRFWAPGVYIRASFTGSNCDVLLDDEELYGKSHNYIEIVIDDNLPMRIQTTGKTNVIKAARGLKNSEHTITICKDTESGIGYVEFAGLRCEQLLSPAQRPGRKIEFIGNSITCGAGSDTKLMPCNKGEWYDTNNAYMSYGAITSRILKAEWQLSSVSGIGLIRSCCNMTITMPQVFDKMNMRNDTILWNFTNYIPDVVTVCLGQNDGVQDSATFCSAYFRFISKIRGYYPNADIICLTSPMADENLLPVMKKYIQGIVSCLQTGGDVKVHYYIFSKWYHNGCGGHPDLAQHQEIANELSNYIKKIKNW